MEIANPPIYLHLIFARFQFEISSLMNWIFWSISNWNFAGYTGSKYQVQTGEKIKFIKLDVSSWNFAKVKCR